MLLDAIGSFSALRLERLDGAPGLLHRAGHEAADGVLLPSHLVHDLSQSSAVLALEHGDDLGGFATFARPGGFLCLGGLFGCLLGRGGLLGFGRRGGLGFAAVSSMSQVT